MSEPTLPIAIVGVSAILPDAPDVATFWHNLEEGRYSISDVDPERCRELHVYHHFACRIKSLLEVIELGPPLLLRLDGSTLCLTECPMVLE